jgi:O-antigen/teichoic acid export membrane protein
MEEIPARQRDHRLTPRVVDKNSRTSPNGTNGSQKNPPFVGTPALARIRALCNVSTVLETIRGKRRFLKEMFGVAWGQIAAAVGGICGVRILTGLLRPAAYGELALGLTVSTLTQLVLFAPICASGQRFLAASRKSGETQSFLEAIALLFGGVSGFLVWHYAAKWLPLMGAALLLSWIAGANAILDSIQNAARERNVVAWHQAFGQWLRALLPLGLAAVYIAGSTMAMSAYCLAATLVFVSQLTFFWRTILSQVRWLASDWDAVRRKVAEVWGYSWPFVTWGLFTWAQSSSDRWALEAFRQKADVGVYQVLYQIGYSPIVLITGYIVVVAGPILFTRVGQGGPAELNNAWSVLKRIIAASLAGTVFASAIAACFRHTILSLLVAAPYRGGAPLLPFLTLDAGLFATGQFATLQLMCNSRTKMLIAPKIVTAVLGISANLVGSYCWGLLGVCAAGAVTSSVYFLWILRIARKQMRDGDGLSQTGAPALGGSLM